MPDTKPYLPAVDGLLYSNLNNYDQCIHELADHAQRMKDERDELILAGLEFNEHLSVANRTTEEVGRADVGGPVVDALDVLAYYIGIGQNEAGQLDDPDVNYALELIRRAVQIAARHPALAHGFRSRMNRVFDLLERDHPEAFQATRFLATELPFEADLLSSNS